MFENELQDLRRFQWRVDTSTRAIFTADDAREFLHNVGFCLEYPLRSPVLAPTFIGAVIGSDQNLPTAKYAFIHPRAKEATEFKDRLLREKSAFEAGFGEDDNLLISAIEFPYFYALIGDRNPKVPPSAGERGERTLLKRAFELIQEHGPILETDLRERLGETVSDVALSRTLSELRQKLRIVRIEDTGGPVWDLLMRWSPEVVNQGKQISAQEALSALVGKYLETCVAAEQKEVEEFFGHLVPRSRVTEVIKALLAAREFSFIQVNAKNLLRNSPRVSAEEKAAQIAAAAAPKPEGRANRSFKPRPEGEAAKKNVWEKYGPKQDRARPDKFDKRDQREDRPWQKAAGVERPAGGSAGKRHGKKAGGRPERSGGRFEKKDWKKAGPPRPWQKPMGAPAAGEGAPAERSFRPAGDRPPKRFGEKREWKPEGRAGGFAGKRDWEKLGDRGPKKFGEGRAGAGPRKEWKAREGGANAGAPKREWKKTGAGGVDARGARDAGGPRKEWKQRPSGLPDFKKFGKKSSVKFDAKFGAKKPWEQKAAETQGAASAEGGSSAPGGPETKASFQKASFKKPFKKAGQAGGGFKKPFKKPFKKSGGPGSFKKPFQKSAGPGGFKKPFKKAFKKSAGSGGAKPRARRPA